MRGEKAYGTSVHVGFHPSKVGIFRLKLDEDGEKIWEGEPSADESKGEGKSQEETVEKMQEWRCLTHNSH